MILLLRWLGQFALARMLKCQFWVNCLSESTISRQSRGGAPKKPRAISYRDTAYLSRFCRREYLPRICHSDILDMNQLLPIVPTQLKHAIVFPVFNNTGNWTAILHLKILSVLFKSIPMFVLRRNVRRSAVTIRDK